MTRRPSIIRAMTVMLTLVSSVASLIMFAPPASGDTITVTPIPVPPWTWSIRMVNDAGVVVMNAIPPGQVAVRRVDGSTFRLDEIDEDLLPEVIDVANDLSNAGFIVGRNANGGRSNPWLYDPRTGHRVRLPTTGFTTGSATGVNTDGTAVGWVSASVFAPVPAVWDGTDHALHELPVPAGQRGVATDINDDGIVVGIVGDQAVAWDLSTDTMTELVGGRGADASELFVNAMGQIQGQDRSGMVLWPSRHEAPLVLDTTRTIVNDAGFVMQIVPAADGTRDLVRWNTVTGEHVVVDSIPADRSVHTSVNNRGQVFYDTTLTAAGPYAIDLRVWDPRGHRAILPPAYVGGWFQVGNRGLAVWDDRSRAFAFVTVEFGPTAPMAVAATAGLSSVMTNWSPPASAGDAAITGYRVHRNGVLIGETDADTRTFIDEEPPMDEPNTYAVSAINSFGESPEAMAAEAITIRASHVQGVVAVSATPSFTG